ncbi:MAG: LPS assembly protein LptD [Chromatiales bacterium]|nr:LPS assembly protein LptD [Gammaproteobacteria bacterium]MCP5351963.1 LPS assembly protein LptD [Chromatiales bacterium]
MPRQSRKLRLLILATLASAGASTSFVVQAGPTAWSCQTDPLTGGWNCAQTGDKASAENAVRMAQRAAGNPEPTDAQIEIATSAPATSPAPVAQSPLADTMAKARQAEEQTAPSLVATPAAPTFTPPTEAAAEPVIEPVAEPKVVAETPVAPAPRPAPEPQRTEAPTLAIVERSVIDLPAKQPKEPPPDEPEAPTPPPVTESAEPSPVEAEAPAAERPEAAASVAPAADEYAFARRVGQLSDADIAALREARANLELGEAVQGIPQNEALARLQTLVDGTDDAAIPTGDHAPADWPEAAFAEPETVAPVHIAYETVETYPAIDNRRAWALCGANSDPSMTQGIPVQAAPNREGLPTFAIADDVQGKRQQYYTLFGDAELRRGDQTLQGDIIHYDATKERADAEGNVRYREAGLAMDSDWGYLVMANDTGEFGPSNFFLPERHARGTAEHVDVASRTLMQGQTTTYTTCNHGDDTWYLDSASVELDRGTGVGTAINAWLKFHGVPLAYTPWITFPIDDRRKSGLLTPSYGSSEINGTEISLPYYWNIAPHRDATITPYLMSERGVRVDTEFRYLNPESEGLIEVDVLPNDDIYSKDRGLFHWQHTAQLADNLGMDIYASHVSDPYYLKDFRNTLFSEDTSNLPRYLRLNWNPGDWQVVGSLHEDYLISLPAKASRPYRRVPEITATTSHFDAERGLDMGFSSRAVYFQNSARQEAGRLDLKPVIRYPIRASYGHITPEIEIGHTQWHLVDAGANGADPNQYLTVPSFALDSELFIEKEFEFDGDEYIHSVEPRIRYTYTPNIDQSTRPIFDTGLNGLSYATLFLNNRFSSSDRYGDANQIAVGVTQRLMNANYADLIKFSMGELFYLSDREVTIGAKTDAERTPNSDFVTELTASLPFGLSATSNLRWDHKADKTPDHNWQISYAKSAEDYITYNYSYRRDISRESTLGFGWSLSPRWHVIGRYEYNHITASNVTNLFGVEYETCCWVARLAAETNYQTYTTASAGTAPTLESDTAIKFQIEFKGLAGLGNNIKEFFGSSAYY